MGSRARHMWREQGARTKRLGHHPNLCLLPSVRAQPWKAGGHNIVEQISSNLSVLVWGLQWEGCSPVPSQPACPTDQPSLPFTLPTHRKTDEMSAGGVRAVGICVCCGPSMGHSCVLSAGQRLPWRKNWTWRRTGTAMPCSHLTYW